MRRFLTATVTLLVLASFAAGCASTSTDRHTEDARIQEVVKAKLVVDTRLPTRTDIEVGSNNGVVTLSGVVNSRREKMIAGDAARMDGVVRVYNELQIRKP